MYLKDLFSKKFVITSEVGPPKGFDLSKVVEEVKKLKTKIDAFNVTDLQSSVMRLSSLAACKVLKDEGVEPILQITCRDRNRLSLQSELLSAACFGIENVLCLTGDHPRLGDDPNARPVFDLDSVSLIYAARQLEKGLDLAGNKLEGPFPKFCLGAVVSPAAEFIEPQILKMEKKVAAGADFIQTQAVFEPEKLKSFREKTKHIKVPVQCGLVLLKSGAMAKFMNENVAGVSVPEGIIQEMAACVKDLPKEDKLTRLKKQKEKAVEIAARIMREIKPMCEGVHIMALGWDSLIPEILDKAGL